MLKFSANLSFLFAEVPFPGRFERAAGAGFDGVEFMSPYEYSPVEVAGWAKDAGVEVVLFNLPAGDWAAGERGLACLPGGEAEFRASVEQALEYAEALACRRLHCLSGLRPENDDDASLRARYIANLRHAADRFAGIGAQVLIEPINSRIDMPGYWLDSLAGAFTLRDEIDRPNVAVQFDVYHAAIIGGDPLPWLDAHLADIGHIQVADHPGRHEPGTGRIDFPAFFAFLEKSGYQGWIGCEYRPSQRTESGLGWLHPYRRSAR